MSTRWVSPLLLWAAICWPSCEYLRPKVSGTFALPEGGAVHFEVVQAFPGLSFERPVDLQAAPGPDSLLYVVEQAGKIWVLDPRAVPAEKRLFLDIHEQVDDDTNEEGLLGLAFHPDFARNGYFFLNYTTTDPDLTRIARWQVGPDGLPRLDSERILLTYAQPYWNHNGGGLAFGPDGYLYVAVGDGGSGGDPQGHGQDRSSLLGSVLRLDVDPDSSDGYRIPPDNPFVGNTQGWRPEIFAYGLRNPWRISFDPETGTLWTGDVGQNAYEEIDTLVAGGNYGWNRMEGYHCFSPETGCDTTGLLKPVWEYSHQVGSSITGGYVYRGTRLPMLAGHYLFADFVTGRVEALPPGGGAPVLLLQDYSLHVSSFGRDARGEIYLCAFDGYLYRLEARPA